MAFLQSLCGSIQVARRETTRLRSAASRLLILLATVTLLLVGFALRTCDLTGTPPGIDGDEMFYFLDASRVLLGDLQIYYPTNFGHEPLFIYAEAVMIWLLGSHAFALRYTAVIGGMLSLAIGYALARRLFGARVALVTVALLATLFWPVFTTRIGLRAFTYPLFSMFSIYTLWRALQERSWRWTVAAGVFNGLILYTYLASRVFPTVILLWLLVLLILDRRWLIGNGWRIVTVLSLAGLVILPFVIYAIRNPDVVNQRMYTMGGPYYQIQRGDYSGLVDNIGKVLGMATVRGDPEVRYNADARPVFEPFTGALFCLGIVTALLRGRRPAYYLLFIWLLAGLIPTLMAVGAPSFLRSSGALFPFLALPGIGIDGLQSFLRRYQPLQWRWPGVFVPAVLAGALALALSTASAMFGPWRTSPGLMAVYESDLYLAARYLDHNPPAPDASIFGVAQYASDNASVIFGLQSHQPDRVRWTADFVWPSAQSETWYLFTQDSLPDAQTRAWLGTPPAYSEFDNAGGTVLEVYRLARPPALPQPAIPLQARFDSLVDLVGVSYPGPFVRGQSAAMLLFWRVRSDASFDVTKPLGVRVRLESRGIPWAEGGSALVSFPPSQWRAGDVWVQRVNLDVPADMPPQSIQPELVLHVDGQEWPVISQGEAQAHTRYLLPVIEVTGQPTETLPSPSSVPCFGDALALRSVSASATASQPGLPVFIHTTWQALRDLDRDYALQIQLSRPDGSTAALTAQTIWDEVYPTHRWRQGEQVSSNDPLRIPVDIQAGDYRLEIRTVDAEGQPVGTGEWLDIGPVQISGRPHVFESPPVEVALDAEVEGLARLMGYRLDLGEAEPGGVIRLTLIWQALQPTERPVRVFTHLYNMNDMSQVYAQHDGDPAGGQAPTTGWLPGEFIEDEHVLPIDPSAPPGDYRLGVGMYDPETLQRLTIHSGNESSPVLILTDFPVP
jgi:hypothetical protein